MATETQKPIDATTPAVEAPKKTLDATTPVPPTATATATKPDRPEETTPSETLSDPAPASDVGSEENGSKAGHEDPKAANGSVAGDGAAPVNSVEKKMKRAERFGITVQLTEEEKRNSRAERFGTVSTGAESEKSEVLKRKARAERFGTPGPVVASEEDAKKKARLARFAPITKADTKADPQVAPITKADTKADPQEEEKRKARALRFAKTSSGSVSQVDNKGNIEPKAAIAGSAGAGV